MENSSDAVEKLDELLAIARRAGEAIMKVYAGADHGVEYKKDNSPLTKADLAANEVIISGLTGIASDIPILSEESKQIPFEERKDWPLFWLVDPLDGTKEFISRNGEFTVNLALIENGAPMLGVVNAPALGVTYWGGAGMGAFKQADGGEPVPIKAGNHTKDGLKVAVTRSHATEELVKFLSRLGDHDSVAMGSSLKFCIVADGSANLYPRLGPTSEWDTAAAQAVVEGAGGAVTALDGAVLHYNKENILNPYFIVTGDPAYQWRDAANGL